MKVLVSISVNTSYSKCVSVVNKSKHLKTSVFSPVVQLSRFFARTDNRIGNDQILSRLQAKFQSRILLQRSRVVKIHSKTRWQIIQNTLDYKLHANTSNIVLGFFGYEYARCPSSVFRTIDDFSRKTTIPSKNKH